MAQAFTAGSMIDIQGFVYWDPNHLTAQWHSFSGWELHPLTAWRLHQSSVQPDFSVSASPSTVSVAQGSSATSTVALTSLNGFSGAVNLSATVSPAGPMATLNPVSVSVSAGGTSSSTLTFGAAITVAPGSYEVIVTGASGSLSHSVLVSVNIVSANDFTMSANPSYITIEPGSTGSSIISLVSLKGFSGTVGLSASISPSGPLLTINPSNQAISSGSMANSTLTVSTTSNALGGNYSITVKGSGNGIAHTVTLKLTVGSNFTISANPSSLTFLSGSSSQSAIKLQSVGFAGTISLTDNVSAAGLTTSLNPTGITLSPGQSHSSILAVSSETPGRYTITVLGKSDAIIHAVNVTINVADFSLSAIPSRLTIQAGSSEASTVALNSLDGFTGSVSLSSSISPGGPHVSFNPSSVTLVAGGTGTSNLLVSTNANNAATNYTITLKGSAGSITHVITITLTVTAGLAIWANPSSLTFLSGSTSKSNINLQSLGLTGTVTLADQVSRTGLLAVVSPTSMSFSPGETHSATLTVSSSSPGTYIVTVTATVGSLSKSANVTVDVTDFSLAATPITLSIAPGSSANSTVTLTSLYGFSGTVNLQASVTPSGPTLKLSSNGVSLSAGSTKTALLIVAASSTTPAGSYTIILKATDGSLVHSIKIIVTVT